MVSGIALIPHPVGSFAVNHSRPDIEALGIAVVVVRRTEMRHMGRNFHDGEL